MESCEEYRCENGWLVVDGELDSIVLNEGDGSYEYLPLIIPTEFTACPCNPLWSLNPEMEAQL